MTAGRLPAVCRAMAAAMLSLLLLTACHSKRETRRASFKPHKRTEAVAPHSGDSHGGVAAEDDGWATLTVKLTRHDNRKLYDECRQWLGVPYLYGGQDKDGTDCSGFVMQVYKAVYDRKIERNSARIFERNCEEIDKDELREGDLVFFVTGRTGRISHVGLYLKDGKFVHASSSRGVRVSDLGENYYVKHFKCAGRVRR